MSNRAQRRREQKVLLKSSSSVSDTLKFSSIAGAMNNFSDDVRLVIKRTVDDEVKKAVEKAKEETTFELIELFSYNFFIVELLAAHDCFGFGHTRLERYRLKLKEMWDSLADGDTTIEMLKERLVDECNIVVDN